MIGDETKQELNFKNKTKKELFASGDTAMRKMTNTVQSSSEILSKFFASQNNIF